MRCFNSRADGAARLRRTVRETIMLSRVLTDEMPTKTDADRTDFYKRLDPHSIAALWTRLGSLVPPEPKMVGVPHRWEYAALRPLLMESARLISAKEAERRVLLLENPDLLGTSRIAATLYAGLQLILPGETAPAHRHSQSAFRFIVEGSGAYTAVGGERAMMELGDFFVSSVW